MSIFVINQGAQPIIGFNSEAKQYDRVKKSYSYSPTVFNIQGIWMALVFADFISAAVTAIIVMKKLRTLKNTRKKQI